MPTRATFLGTDPRSFDPEREDIDAGPLAKRDFHLFQSLGKRLLFGMSLPTLNNHLARIYEPKAPAPRKRLEILQAAAEAGISVTVALAPTSPEVDEVDLRATLTASSSSTR